MTPQQVFQPHSITLGSGPRRMLALHCTMAFGGAWKGFANHLGKDVALVAPDMPSHGASMDWDGSSDFAKIVHQGSLDAMDDAPMDVIGHSFGAAIALKMAVTHPEKIRSLALYEPVFFAVAAARDPASLEDYDAVAHAFNAATRTGDWELSAREFNAMWSDDAPTWDSLPEGSRAAMARAVRVVPGTKPFLYEDSAGMLAPGALDAVQIPTLLMHGRFTHPAATATNKGLVEIMPNATSKVIEGAGHMGPITHPGLVADAVRELLERS